MKLEVEMTQEQLNLLILSTEVYARALMNQPDLVADNIDKSLYDVRASEPYHGGTEPLMWVRVMESWK